VLWYPEPSHTQNVYFLSDPNPDPSWKAKLGSSECGHLWSGPP
jgi:hypothetical protein